MRHLRDVRHRTSGLIPCSPRNLHKHRIGKEKPAEPGGRAGVGCQQVRSALPQARYQSNRRWPVALDCRRPIGHATAELGLVCMNRRHAHPQDCNLAHEATFPLTTQRNRASAPVLSVAVTKTVPEFMHSTPTARLGSLNGTLIFKVLPVCSPLERKPFKT